MGSAFRGGEERPVRRRTPGGRFPKGRTNRMSFSYLGKYYPYFIVGARNAVLLSLFSLMISVMLGVVLALCRLGKLRIVKFLATAYVEFIRGTPLMIQLYMIFYGLPMMGLRLPTVVLWGTDISRFLSGVIAMALNSAAYVCEIIRSGIQSVNKGQMEASRSLGFNYSQSMWFVILPQAFKNILPALGNEFVTVIKESSVISVIGVQELTYNAGIVRSITYQALSPMFVAAAEYFVLTFTLSKILGHFEHRMKAHD